MADNISTTVLNRLKQFFRLGVKPNAKDVSDQIYPIKKVKDNDGGTSFKREAFSAEAQKYYDRWLHMTHDDAESWKNRQDLWNDMEMMYYNSSIISRSIEFMADEVVQVDSTESPITVEAKRKQKKFILEFFDKINIYEKIRPTAVDIIQFGNAGWILSFDATGVESIIPTSVFNINDRLEFSAMEVKRKLTTKDRFFTDYRSKVQRIDQLVQMVSDKDNIASEFNSYLFGFQIGDKVIPPWRFLHFRNLTTKSPFAPFGIPMFIHSISPYRQYDASMTMQQAARGARLPIDIWKLTFPEGINESEKLSRAHEFINEYQNSGINNTRKEVNGVGEAIVTIADLFEFDQKESNIDLGKIDDIEMLRDDLIVSTFLPRNIIDPNDSSFGDSGVSLIEKWKPFARTVYRIQQIILNNISQLVKLHMIYSGEFSLDEIDFVLKMPYPESQANRDIIDSQNDLRDLANGIIDDFSDKFLGGEMPPADVMKSIYMKFLPYDDATIEKWVKDMIKSQENPEDATEEKSNGIKRFNEWQKAVGRHGGQEKLKENLQNVIFLHKQENLREGVINRKHYHSSRITYEDLPAELLVELDLEQIRQSKQTNKLTEQIDELNLIEEYTFTFEETSEEGEESE